MTDLEDFAAYLRQCTDAQIQGVYDTERAAGREPEYFLARAEARLRGIELTEPGPRTFEDTDHD
jgi:hypothetical protein